MLDERKKESVELKEGQEKAKEKGGHNIFGPFGFASFLPLDPFQLSAST